VFVTSKYEEYHRAADHCLQMALNARNPAHRASWLKLAQGWLQMIPADQVKIAEWTFDAAMRARGNAQTGKQPSFP